MKKNLQNKTKKQNKKSGSKKYDRGALKLEFLVSPIGDISERWRHKRGTAEAPQNGNFKKQTKGWLEDKKKLKEEVAKEAMESLKKELVEVYKPSSEELSDAHKKIFTLIQATINTMMERLENGEVSLGNIKTIKSLREMIKIEKGEPTKYVQQDATSQISFDEDLSQDEIKKIDQLLS